MFSIETDFKIKIKIDLQLKQEISLSLIKVLYEGTSLPVTIMVLMKLFV